MVSLQDFTPPRVKVMYRDSPLMEVRGLNLSDISKVLVTRLDQIRVLAKAHDDGDLFNNLQTERYLFQLLAEAPELAYDIIAIACDEPPEVASQVKLLPLGVQMQALSKIVKLTLEDVGGPKGLAALVRTMIDQK